MKIITRAALLLISLLLVQPLSLAAGMLPTLAVHAQSGYPKVSPFDDLRWHKGLPDVKVDGEWYVFKAIDGVSVETVFATIKGRWSSQPCERFAEDLYEAVSRSGTDCGKTVTLTVTRIGSDKTLELKGVSMNEAKRRFLRGKHDDGEEPKRGGASEEAPAARKLLSCRPHRGPRVSFTMAQLRAHGLSRAHALAKVT